MLVLLSQVVVGASGLFQVVVTLIVLGVLLYVVETLLPIDPAIRRIIHVVVILVACLWLLRVFGIF